MTASLSLLVALTLVAFIPRSAVDQAAFSMRPITILAAMPLGGSADVFAPLMARNPSQRLRRAVVVDSNRSVPGNIVNEYVSGAQADLYTLSLGRGDDRAVWRRPSHELNVKLDSRREAVPS